MTTENETKSLSLDDVMCPICLDVVVEPVTMSCKHELCKDCYMDHFKSCNFFCPICKVRLSTWARKAAANGTLVNQKKWLLVKKEYPDLVLNRQKGLTNTVFLQCERNKLNMKVADPGELNAEYVAMREQWLLENSVQKRLEEEASLKLIKQLQREEKKEEQRAKQLQQKSDERLARQLSKELAMKVSPSKVNRAILRPRKSLSTFNENVPRCSGIQAAPTLPKLTPQKRKRKLSEEF